MQTLIQEYFTEVNAYWPLLHLPSLKKDVEEELYLRDPGFASVLLCICAIGSRYIDDERVFLDGRGERQTPGWKWFRQINVMRQSPWVTPSLYDLQLCSVRVSISVHQWQCPWLMLKHPSLFHAISFIPLLGRHAG